MTEGKAVPACRVCGNSVENRRHAAREMMFGLRDPFDYVECGACGCLQIEAIPADLSKYYPPEYYSFRAAVPNGWKRWLKRCRAAYAMGRPSVVGRLLAARYGSPPYVAWVRTAGISLGDPVLDVGCGGGRLLLDMSLAGFRNLTGVDPYVPADISYPGGVRVLKRTLSEVEGRFRLILFNHSFEHLEDPVGALREAGRALEASGTVLIRIPVTGSHAWRTYGVNWVQLDAPRHVFLHTERSLGIVAKEAGFEIVERRWDSEAFQFWGSEQYARDIPLFDPRSYLTNPRGSIFTEREIRAFEEEARMRNERAEGDSAAFYLRRSRVGAAAA